MSAAALARKRRLRRWSIKQDVDFGAGGVERHRHDPSDFLYLLYEVALVHGEIQGAAIPQNWRRSNFVLKSKARSEW